MRVTSGMIRNTSLNSLYNNMSKLDTLFNQMNTLKKIQRPSDDPIVAGRSMKLRLDVMQSYQYESNVQEAMGWLDATENALSNVTEIMKDIRTRVVQASNGSLTDEDRDKILQDLEQLREQVRQEANGTYSGRYLFSGFKTNEPIYDKDGNLNKALFELDVNGDIAIEDGKPKVAIEGQEIEYEISAGVTMTINVTDLVSTLYKFEEMMDDIEAIITDDSIPDDEKSELLSAKLDEIDEILSEVSKMTASVGARQNRLLYTEERLKNDQVNLTELLSATEDVDIEEVYVNFNTQYMVYQSALQATSKIVMNNLGDFL